MLPPHKIGTTVLSDFGLCFKIYTYATDEEALKAHVMVTKFEKLNPSLEPSHAFAEAIKIAPNLSKDTIIIVNSCGDAKKDRDILRERLGKNQ